MCWSIISSFAPVWPAFKLKIREKSPRLGIFGDVPPVLATASLESSNHHPNQGPYLYDAAKSSFVHSFVQNHKIFDLFIALTESPCFQKWSCHS